MIWALVIILHAGGWDHNVAISSIPYANERRCFEGKAVLERELKELRIPSKLMCVQTGVDSK